jgi:Asp-tRNA(Asn)/Glu-tRNA(Gln) amidotransferase A subunit family amidase
LFELAAIERLVPSSHFLDIRDSASLTSLVKASQPDVVLHLAAQALVRRSYEAPVETFATNVLGTVHLLEALRQPEAFPYLTALFRHDAGGALRRLASMADARAADEARRQGRLTGPLHGLPMTIKDIFATRGLVTTSGHLPLADYTPEADAPAVAALRAAGAVVFGKTNLPEFGGDIQSYNDIHGLCRTPWNPERTAGGSSGGSGAALASGMTLLELGSDIGGSIRVPCHYHGVFGHKPTWNAVDRLGEGPRPPVWAHALMDHNGGPYGTEAQHEVMRKAGLM